MTEATQVDKGAWIMRLVLIALGLAITIGGASYGVFQETGLVGAGFVPVMAGGIMVLAGLWEAATEFRAQQRTVLEDQPDVATAAGVEVEAATAETVEEILDVDGDGTLAAEAAESDLDVFGRTEAESRRAVIYVFAVLLLTTFLSHVIGLLLALSLMVFILLKFVERKSWVAAIIGAVLAFAFGWGVFGELLSVPLPTGMLGIV